MESENKPSRVRKTIIILAIVFGGLLFVGLGVIGFIMGDLSTNYNSVLELSAKAINLNTPKMLSDGIRLDSVAAKPGLELWYYYTLTEIERDEETIQEFCEVYELNTIESLSNEESVKEFGKNNVSLVFELTDKNGTLMCTSYVAPDMYYKATETR